MPKETWHPSLLFSFPFLLFFFSPGIFYSLHVSSLKQSTQHRIPPLLREGSAVGRAAAFASSSDSLTFRSIVPLAHTQPSHCLLVWPWCWELPVLCASYAHGSTILFQGKDTGHMDRVGHSTSWVLLICSLCRGLLFMKTHLFTKCVPVMAAGCPEALGCADPECHEERWESSKHPLPAHLGTSSRKKGLNNSYPCSPPNWIITFLGKGGIPYIFTLILRGYMYGLSEEWMNIKESGVSCKYIAFYFFHFNMKPLIVLTHPKAEES